MICFIQELISNIISRFLIRTLGDQKTTNPYIQRAKRKKQTNKQNVSVKNSVCDKTVLHSEVEMNTSPEKPKVVCYH